MTERIHDDEPDTGEHVVRALLAAECAQWVDRPVEYLRTSGTDNAMWRVRLVGEPDEPDVVVRLPRRAGSAAGVATELAVLDQLAASALAELVEIPVRRHAGHEHPRFPHRWSVLQWVDGADLWTARDELDARQRARLAADLGAVVRTMRSLPDIDAPPRPAGSRGGPFGPLLDRLRGWLHDPRWDAGRFVDVAAIERIATDAADLTAGAIAPGFVHGDLIPGNLLVRDGRLAAVIDWGGAGTGDPAQDLAPAWSVFDEPERAEFRDAAGVDESTWRRGRVIELEHAVGGVLYYVPRKHPLGDAMSRTLNRIIADQG